MCHKLSLRITIFDKIYIFHGFQNMDSKSLPNICSSNIGQPVRLNLISHMSSDQVNNLCLASKSCNRNICKNRLLWEFLYREKYQTDPPLKGNIKNYYYGRRLIQYKITSEDITPFENILRFANKYLDIYLIDVNRNLYIWSKNKPCIDTSHKADQIIFGPSGLYFILFDNNLYKTSNILNETYTLALTDVEYCLGEQEWISLKTKTSYYALVTGRGSNFEYLGENSWIKGMWHAPTRLCQIDINLDGLNVTSNLIYFQFDSHYLQYGKNGCFILEGGDLYAFIREYNGSQTTGSVKFYFVANHVQSAYLFTTNNRDHSKLFWQTTSNIIYEYSYPDFINSSDDIIDMRHVIREKATRYNDFAKITKYIGIRDSLLLHTIKGNVYLLGDYPKHILPLLNLSDSNLKFGVDYQIKPTHQNKDIKFLTPFLLFEHVVDINMTSDDANVLFQN